MPLPSSSPPPSSLWVLIGPTASGKSGLALKIAAAWKQQQGRDCVIVNADSVQCYGEIPILAGAPSPADFAHTPHRLYGMLRADQPLSAADWASQATAVIRPLLAEGKQPILVGGTGLYLRTIMEGIAPIPAVDPEIRAHIRQLAESEGAAGLHARLQPQDPQMAAHLKATDTQRLCRALEVWESTGKSVAFWQGLPRVTPLPDVQFHCYALHPEREMLYAECDRRFLASFRHGASEEVAAILAHYPEESIRMRALGFQEIKQWLAGECTEAAAIASASQAIRRYAKRQMTWIRHQCPNAQILTEIGGQIMWEGVQLQLSI